MERIYTLTEITGVVEELVAYAGLEARAKVVTGTDTSTVMCFDATMGAGKTTLINEICKQLGVVGSTSSPTFSIVNEYEGKFGTIYHFDLYRLEHIDELYNLGFEEYLDQPALLLIEWPDLALPFLETYYHIQIQVLNEQTRKISFNRTAG